MMEFETIKKEIAQKGEAALTGALRAAFGAVGSVRLRTSLSPVIPQEIPRDWQSKPGKHWRVGFGKATLLPEDFYEKTYYVAGYSENNPATGCLDAPHVHALWLDDCTGRGALLLVSADAVGLLNADVLDIRKSLADFVRTTGCRGVHIMSTHDHASIDTMGNWGPLPRTGRDKQHMRFFREQVKKAAIDAKIFARSRAASYATRPARARIRAATIQICGRWSMNGATRGGQTEPSISVRWRPTGVAFTH